MRTKNAARGVAGIVSCLALLNGCGVQLDDAEKNAVGSVEQAATITAYNTDPASIIIYNQNVAQFGDSASTPPATQVAGFYWKNIIRCVRDSTCNGFGVIPDVFVLQEISKEECEAFDNELEAQLSPGSNTWDYVSRENWRSTSYHWMSNCILYRRARFDSTTRQVKDIVQLTGNGDACTDQGTRMLNLAMKDQVRANAGLTGWVSIVDRHDDHFGDTKDSCDNAYYQADGKTVARWDPTTQFCVYQNTKTVGETMAGAILQVMAGDFNYEARHCSASATPAGYPNDYARCHWKAITAGQGDCLSSTGSADKPNLGWYDTVGTLNPAAYSDAKWDIDYIYLRYQSSATLMPATTRNYVPGRIAKGFYTPATDAYWPNMATSEGTATMTDHDGLLVRAFY